MATPPTPTTLIELFHLGVEHHHAGRLPEAETLYRQILEADPLQAEVWHQIGLLAYQLGQPQQATQLIGEALRLRPDDAAAHCNMGNALADCGAWDQAVAHLHQATTLQPAMPEAHLNLGNTLRRRGGPGDLEASLESCQAAIRLRPAMPEAHLNCGNALKALARYDQAVTAFGRAIRLAPDYADAYSNLGSTQQALGQLDEAIANHHHAISLNPNQGLFHGNLGHALREKGLLEQALKSFRTAATLSPDQAKVHDDLGQILSQLACPDQALACFETALKLEPDSAHLLQQMALQLNDMGRTEEALTSLQQAVALAPDRPELHASLIFTKDMTPGIEIQAQQTERQRWVKRYCSKVHAGTHHPNNPDPARRLRVGYVSADFHLHSAASTFGACLLHYDRDQFELYAYANNRTRPDQPDDAVTEKFRRSVDHWRDIAHLDDDALATLVRRDRIDILVDLSGHSTGNRLELFARRPAPIQCTGWGYIQGTGMKTIDYLITDPVILPPIQRPTITEEVLDLPCGVHLQPLGKWPEPAPIPALKRGFITFGTFHRTDKINAKTLKLWAKVLAAVPHSRLLIKIPKNSTDFFGGYYRQSFKSHGVDPQRIELLGATSQFDHLACFNKVDIALDPTPHCGGVTSLEALRMGTPVATLWCETIAGRLSASFNATLNLASWTAESESQFIEIVKIKSSDISNLSKLNSSLRERFDRSILGDHKLYMHHLEALYRQIWQRWVADHLPSHDAS
ncbi:MAG: tetratricopeptide repeat protein [Magnetococcales bacterium]|nr:tetratricopeptide repeat protein [Magnetococcales bacterium]